MLQATADADPGGMAAAFQRYVAQLDVSALTTTPCCQNGSEVKPLQQEKVWIAGSAICAVLGAAWTPLAGAICEVFVPLLLDLGPICAQCPPDPVAPDWTTAWSSGLLPTPAVVWDWAVATFISQTWTTWCQCAGGITGCGTTVVDATATGTGNTIAQGAGRFPIVDTPTNISFPWSATISSAGTSWQVAIRIRRADDSVVTTIALGNGTTGTTISGTYTSNWSTYITAGATQFSFQVSTVSGFTGSNTTHITGTATWSGCGSPIIIYVPPPVIVRPPDIPDPPAAPTGCSTDQICQKITLVEQLLDSLARQLQKHMLPPKTYVAFTSHSPLSGNGSFTVTSITTAVRIRFVTIPPRVGLIVGSPNRRFDVGYFTPYENNGPYQTHHIDYDGQVFELPQPVAGIDYSIPADVVLTIDELSNSY